MLTSLSRFVTKGTMSAVGAVIAWVMGQYGYADLAATLTDPEFLQKVFNWIAVGLTLYAGVAQGIKPKPAAPTEGDNGMSVEALQDLLQPDLSDPYPGWDWDPLRGWVRVNANAP